MNQLLEHFMCALVAVSACNLWLWFGNGNADNLGVGVVGFGVFGAYVYAWHIQEEFGSAKKKR